MNENDGRVSVHEQQIYCYIHIYTLIHTIEKELNRNSHSSEDRNYLADISISSVNVFYYSNKLL